MNHDAIIEAKETCEQIFLSFDDVHAVSIGRKRVDGVKTEQLAIVIHTTDKKPIYLVPPNQRIPKLCNGFPTDVMEMPRFEILPIIYDIEENDPAQSDDIKYRPVPGGVEIYSVLTASTGGICTVGTFATSTAPEDNPEDYYLLTNAHCLPQIDQEVRQPVSDNPIDNIAFATRIVNSNIVDGGIAKMINNSLAQPYYIEDVGMPTGTYNITIENLDDAVIKRGRTTGTTIGFVDYVEVSVNGKEHQIIINSENIFAAPGDSGSVVLFLDGANAHNVIGLLWGGVLSYAVLSPIQAVEEELQIRLLTRNAQNIQL